MCVPGNAAITLRSRLKVKVVKDLLQRAHQQQELNGLLPPSHTTSEAGKVTLQLQVSAHLGLQPTWAVLGLEPTWLILGLEQT